jgi:hypothetical protein
MNVLQIAAGAALGKAGYDYVMFPVADISTFLQQEFATIQTQPVLWAGALGGSALAVYLASRLDASSGTVGGSLSFSSGLPRVLFAVVGGVAGTMGAIQFDKGE